MKNGKLFQLFNEFKNMFTCYDNTLTPRYTYFSNKNMVLYLILQVVFFILFLVIPILYVLIINYLIYALIVVAIHITIFVIFLWFRKFDIYIKEKDKEEIRNNINTDLISIENKVLVMKKLKEIKRESEIVKESLEVELNNSILLNFVSTLMGFLTGFFSKTVKDINTLILAFFLIFVISLTMYFIIDIIRYPKTYKLEMYNYQILYAKTLLENINQG